MELNNNDVEYLGWMNLKKMNKLTSLKLNLTNNNIGEIELGKFEEWIGNKLVDLNLDLQTNEIGVFENEVVDFEVYLDLRVNYFEDI